LDFSSSINTSDLQILSENWLTIVTNLPQPVSYWKFDEGQGIIAYDLLGGNDGSIFGAKWTAGIINTALNFNGFNDLSMSGTEGFKSSIPYSYFLGSKYTRKGLKRGRKGRSLALRDFL
jgi:hypothetical protein